MLDSPQDDGIPSPGILPVRTRLCSLFLFRFHMWPNIHPTHQSLSLGNQLHRLNYQNLGIEGVNYSLLSICKNCHSTVPNFSTKTDRVSVGVTKLAYIMCSTTLLLR